MKYQMWQNRKRILFPRLHHHRRVAIYPGVLCEEAEWISEEDQSEVRITLGKLGGSRRLHGLLRTVTCSTCVQPLGL